MLNNNSSFIVSFILFLILGGIALNLTPKGFWVKWFNQFHSPILNNIVYYLNFLGNGIFYVLIIIGLLFYKIREGLIGLASFLVCGGITQLIKRALDISRPKASMEGFNMLQQVSDIHISGAHSFPSGHSTTIFTLCCLISLIIQPSRWGAGLLILAVIVSLARVYVLQHFFVDIYFGAIIGVTFTTFLYNYGTKSKRINQLDWIHHPLPRLLK